jgi:hypothetical protein
MLPAHILSRQATGRHTTVLGGIGGVLWWPRMVPKELHNVEARRSPRFTTAIEYLPTTIPRLAAGLISLLTSLSRRVTFTIAKRYPLSTSI